MIESKLQAFLAFVVDIGEPDQVPGHLAGRVVTPVFALHVDAGQLECEHLLRLLGAQVTFQVQEFLVHAARDAAHEQLRIEAQRACQPRYFVNSGSQLLRICPDAVYGRAYRKRLAVAVSDRAAVRRDSLAAQVARVGLLVQELLVQHLQVHGTCCQRGRDQREEHQYQCHPADKSLRRPGFRFGSARHGRSMTKISVDWGRTSDSLSSATCSMRA